MRETPVPGGNTGKRRFHGIHRRSVDGTRPVHPAATARPAPPISHPSPEHDPSPTASRADRDNPQHTHQDRRTT
ncbi:hypothetical protein C6Y14_30755 [Streptomyces dioscori]|uniref:Uncharacterized protein n=1 Tax=Streptomyces dioscori TaxID=2109333 RepID=A0A2P8PZV7_9ACTN|nr:hypothetical protein C6Y14_30755 [Streptomyces dioscori]